VSDFLTAQCQLSMDGPRLRPLSIRTEGAEARKTNGADGSDDSDDLVKQQILFFESIKANSHFLFDCIFMKLSSPPCL
jgi:hypothetical protein